MGLIQLRVDDEMKADVEQLYKDMGMDIPSAIRLFFKQSLIRNGLPFTVERDPFYNEYNQARLAEAIDNLNHGRNCAVHELIED